MSHSLRCCLLSAPILAEGRFDRESTRLAHTFINFIKTAILEPADVAQFMASENRWSVSYALSDDITVDFTFAIMPREKIVDKYVASRTDGIDGDIIEFFLTCPDTVLTNPNLWKKYIQQVSALLRRVFRHELEHVAQGRRGAIRTAHQPNLSLDQPEDERFASWMKYISQQHEIEAKVAELYKTAKTQRKPLGTLIDAEIERTHHDFSTLDNSVLEPALLALRSKYIAYAHQRFPRAQWMW